MQWQTPSIFSGRHLSPLVFWLCQVNGAAVDLPFLYEPHIYVELTGRTVLLTTNIGLQVLFREREGV